MSSKTKRIHIAVTQEKYEKWSELAESRYDGNTTQMIRDSVRKNMESLNGEEGPDFEPILNSLEGLHSNVQQNRDLLKTLRVMISAEDDNSKSFKAAKRILDLLLEEDLTPSQVLGKLDHEQETVDGALAILEKLELIDFEQKDTNEPEKSKGGEKT